MLKVFNNDNKWTEDTELANNFWMHELMPSKPATMIIFRDAELL